MANDASKVLVGKPLASGGLLIAPPATALPVDTATPTAVAFKAAGYVSDAGVTQTIGTDTTDIKAWGGDTVRKIQTSHDLTYKCVLIETNGVSLAAYYGADNVTVDEDAITVLINSKELPHGVYVFEVADGSHRQRIVLPDGQITDRGDVVYVDDDVVAYDVTITAYPDSAGNKAYLYQDVPAG